jgi:glycosyltransferase involved in cell wall biosynthesis
MPDLSLTMPMYNEEKIASQVISQIQDVFDKENIDYELVIVNNGSRDKTKEILESLSSKDPRTKVVNIEVNQGYGWGIINGLNNCTGSIIGYVDGDNQIPPEDLIKVYKKLKETDSNFAKGIRYNRGDGIKRIIASFFYNGLFHILFWTSSRDINSKPKFFKKEFYNQLNLESKDWFIDPEIIIKAKKLKIKPKEILVQFHKRREGKSNVSLKTIKEFTKNLLYWRFKK